ncbi:hypothetical protein CHH73_15270 [Shouchella clausii]|nr:hypothetical protein CHH73_15270 [Shouchella clausii]PAD45284.1 hypothetical protein CHI09_18430 [Shouchella clausii]
MQRRNNVRYEQFKTVALIALIGLSLFFTYQLWTFQPNIEALEDSSNVQTEEMFGTERDPVELIAPEQIVLHSSEGTYALVKNGSSYFSHVVEQLFAEGQLQSINRDYEDISAVSGIELIFPDAVPKEFVLKQFGIEQEDFRFNLNAIDRMFVYVSPYDGGVNIQFASLENESLFTVGSAMDPEFLTDLLESGEEADIEEAVIVKQKDDDNKLLQNRLYVSTEPQKVREKQYELARLDIGQINQRLFSGASDVPRQNQLDGQNVYTDGSRIVTIDQRLQYLSYSYPFAADGIDTNNRHIIETAAEFVNLNGGWTDDYKAISWAARENSETVDFRMMIDGIPVFGRNSDNKDRMKITVSRSGTQVIQFERPLFHLVGAPLQDPEVEVPSGEAAAEALKAATSVNWDDVTDIRLGYRADMENNSNANFVPTWYYESQNTWKRVPFDEEYKQ